MRWFEKFLLYSGFFIFGIDKLKSKINADGLEEILNPLMDRTGQFMPDLYQYYHNQTYNLKYYPFQLKN